MLKVKFSVEKGMFQQARVILKLNQAVRTVTIVLHIEFSFLQTSQTGSGAT